MLPLLTRQSMVSAKSFEVMDLTIRTKTNQNIMLFPGVSSGDYYNLPGSSSWFSKTSYGNFYFQERQSGPFTIRHSFLQVLKKITLFFQSQTPRAGVRISLENQWNVGLPGEGVVTLQ